jgi:hypothetical protein
MTNKYLEKIEEHKIYDAVFEENKKPEKPKAKKAGEEEEPEQDAVD